MSPSAESLREDDFSSDHPDFLNSSMKLFQGSMIIKTLFSVFSEA